MSLNFFKKLSLEKNLSEMYSRTFENIFRSSLEVFKTFPQNTRNIVRSSLEDFSYSTRVTLKTFLKVTRTFVKELFNLGEHCSKFTRRYLDVCRCEVQNFPKNFENIVQCSLELLSHITNAKNIPKKFLANISRMLYPVFLVL